MNSNRHRPYLERACKKQEFEAAGSFDNGAQSDLELSPKLWRELPTGLAYKVLSYLPVDRLVDTLRHVNRNFLTSLGFFEIFGHGGNLLSSYRFVMVPNGEVPRLVAFEHESMQWREFSKTLPAEVMQTRLISGGNNGLLMFKSKKCRITNLTIKQMNAEAMDLDLFSPDIGVWNPLLHSFKWLPANPQLQSSYFTSVVMVDEPSKTYKVFLNCRNFSSTDEFYLGHYSVYNNTTGIWSCSKPIPSFVDYEVDYDRFASCSRYIVFGDANGNGEDSLCRYDVERDSWDRFFVSKMLTDLDYSSREDSLAWIDSFAILRGILYTLIRNTSKGIVMASTDLSAEIVTFKLETIVEVPSLALDLSGFFNLYTYTLKGKGFVCVRMSSTPNRFRHFDVSRGDWLESDKFLDLGIKGWQSWFSFKPSFVIP